MDTSDQNQIIRMMDDEDGVINRRKKKQGPAKKKEDHRLLLEGESTDDPDSQVATVVHRCYCEIELQGSATSVVLNDTGMSPTLSATFCPLFVFCCWSMAVKITVY